MKPRQNHTWLFKKILEERQTALQWVQIDPGDGSNISFWKDPWTKFGQLISFVGHNGPRLTGIPLNATVADIWRDGGWSIQSARSREMEELLIYLYYDSSNRRALDKQWKDPEILL